MRFLGLDLGTTSFKGAVLDLERGTVSTIRRVPTPEPVQGLPTGHHELDPSAVLLAVRRLVGELLSDAPDATGLVLCSQMHCLVLYDADGSPRSNVITWKDQRGAETIDELRRIVSADEQRQIGSELRVGLPITTLPWLKQRGRLGSGLVPASLPDFVLAQLCETPPTTEATNAAAHGLFDLDRGHWHVRLIEKARAVRPSLAARAAVWRSGWNGRVRWPPSDLLHAGRRPAMCAARGPNLVHENCR